MARTAGVEYESLFFKSLVAAMPTHVRECPQCGHLQEIKTRAKKASSEGATCAPTTYCIACGVLLTGSPVSHLQVEVWPELQWPRVQALSSHMAARLSLERALPKPVWMELQRRRRSRRG